MSKHRKIFNLFKFVDEVNSMNKIVNSKKHPFYLKCLVFFSHLGSFFYFIFDNFLWLCHSNISKNPLLVIYFSKEKLTYFKYVKDLGSFWRITFNLVINCLYIKQYSKVKQEITEKLIFMEDKPIEPKSEAEKELRDLLEARFMYRNAWIEVIHSCVIASMLWKSLRFTG